MSGKLSATSVAKPRLVKTKNLAISPGGKIRYPGVSICLSPRSHIAKFVLQPPWGRIPRGVNLLIKELELTYFIDLA